MKKPLFIIYFLLAVLTITAQDYLSGKLIDTKGTQTDILYDRTQNDISFNIYQTIYKIVDADKKPLYTVTITHDRIKSVLFFSIKPQNANPTARTVTYNRTESGLIFSDANVLDAAFNIKSDYTHLFSFTDTLRTYPVIHRIMTTGKTELVLDPLSKLRIRKHYEVIKNIVTPESFNQDLLKVRDSLYVKHFKLNETVSEIRKQIEKDISVLMKDKQVEQDVKRYEGEKRFGNPYGKGLLVLNGNIYDGSFKDGKFVVGNVVIKTADEEYCGEYKAESKNGIGWTKYANGGYLVGRYVQNALSEGIALQKNNGEIYFGGFNGKRNGYGELQNNNGGKYAGVFLDDRLIKGYAKEVDPFGYYTYSHIENGTKTTIDAKTAEDFFGLTLSSAK